MPITHVTFNRERKRWQYQRGIPKTLRPLFGDRTHFPRVWLKDAPRVDTPSAAREAISASEPYKQRDDATIAKAETLAPDERAYVVELGGFEGLSQQVADLEDKGRVSERIAAMAASINHRAPLPNPAFVMPLAPQANARVDYRRPGKDGAMVAPIRDTGKHPIAVADIGGVPHVILPAAPGNWAELRADLSDWAAVMGRNAAAEGERSRAILLKAEPSSEFSFDGLLAVWVKSQGPNWRGRTDNHDRTARLLREILGNVDYRDVLQEDHAIRFRDALESRGGYAWQKAHLERTSAMFAAAVSEGTLRGKANPFSGVSVRGHAADADEDETDLFTPAQLRTLLAKAREMRFGDTQRSKRHVEAIWLLEVMTYGGMRPNEILQLQRGDVCVEPESRVKVMHIRRTCCVTGKRHDEKSMKNPKLRDVLVPLHPMVAGFYDFARGGDGADPAEFVFAAFPYVNVSKKRRGFFDTHFASLLEAAGIEPKPGKKLSLYSIRRSFHRAMDNARIDGKRQRVLTSHAAQDVHDSYSRGAELKALARDLAKVDPLA